MLSYLRNYDFPTQGFGLIPEACVDKVYEWSKRAVGSVYRSRIHGDFNLTNILVTLNEDTSVSNSYIIDLSHSKADSVLALDFARVEQEMWRRISHIEKADLSQAADVTAFINGDTEELPRTLDAHWLSFAAIVNAVRTAAKQYLGGPDNSSMMRDYFPALLFQGVRFLKYYYDGRGNELEAAGLVWLVTSCCKLLCDHRAGYFAAGSTKQKFQIPRQKPSISRTSDGTTNYDARGRLDTGYLDNDQDIPAIFEPISFPVYNQQHTADRFYDCFPVRPGDIIHDFDIPRQPISADRSNQPNIEALVRDGLGGEGVAVRTILLIGPQGTGKSTIALRVVYELWRTGYPVYRLREDCEDPDLLSLEIDRLRIASPRGTVFLIDGAGRFIRRGVTSKMAEG